MSFILRIFFSGLIAFIPSEDGKRVTVLVLNSSHGHHSNNGAVIPEHKPMLLVRAAGCTGDCPGSDPEVAQFILPDAASSAAADGTLRRALQKGAVWRLSGSDLHLGIPAEGVRLVHDRSIDHLSIPETIAQRTDFGWVANLKDIDPEVGKLDPDLFSPHPPEDLVVARLELTSGELSTYSVIQVNGKVSPIEFHGPDGKARYFRAAASWVQAEITVPGGSVTLTESNFKGGAPRKMELKPIKGRVEMAILNISRPVVPKGPVTPQPGTHFERFWDLTSNPPDVSRRAIPYPPGAQVVALKDWKALHPSDDKSRSLLLAEIFRDSRGPFDQVLCPMSQYSPP
ncbi:MAG TPA: hypothetical protein VHW00_19945 [Thermoanaerobaculia bacterium]|nr:hypothetical protein [Thermoanaerobaculia bacterium]